MSHGKRRGMLKTMLVYGFALAAGAIALQWLEYRIWARTHAGTVYVALVAAAEYGCFVHHRAIALDARHRLENGLG